MITPSFLKAGDKIAVIATARRISIAELGPAIQQIKNWGFDPVLGQHIFESDNQFAGTDEQRAHDLQWAVNDENIKAILIARGGYGTLRVIDKIDFSAMEKHPKWIIGYSDVTVLHSHLHKNFRTATLHATMPINFAKNTKATESLRRCLTGENITYTIPAHPLNRAGEAKGEIIGGNLSLLYALCGSSSDIDTREKILFLEDLDEYLYHVDRMMLNLKRSGKLQYLKGLVIGGMTEMKDNAIPFGKTAEEIVYDAVKEYSYPVCFNFPAGHIDENMAIYLGKEASLDVGKETCTLKY